MGQNVGGRRLAVLRRNVTPLEPLRATHVPFSAPSSGQEERLIRRCRLASLFWLPLKYFYHILKKQNNDMWSSRGHDAVSIQFLLQLLPPLYLSLLADGCPRPRTKTIRGCHMSSASKPYLYA